MLARPGLPADFYFDSLQSGRGPAGVTVGACEGADGDPESVVLEEIAADGTKRVSMRSEAILRALVSLGGAWRLMGVFFALPRPLRDFVYRWIASHRYAWFGRRDTCRLPTAAEKARFLS